MVQDGIGISLLCCVKLRAATGIRNDRHACDCARAVYLPSTTIVMTCYASFTGDTVTFLYAILGGISYQSLYLFTMNNKKQVLVGMRKIL